MTLRVRPAAQADVDESAGFISADSLAAGQRFLQAFRDTLKGIIERPRLGRIVEIAGRLQPELRSVPVSKFEHWRVYYQVFEDAIEIVRVLHGARDIGPILAGEFEPPGSDEGGPPPE